MFGRRSMVFGFLRVGVGSGIGRLCGRGRRRVDAAVEPEREHLFPRHDATAHGPILPRRFEFGDGVGCCGDIVQLGAVDVGPARSVADLQ